HFRLAPGDLLLINSLPSDADTEIHNKIKSPTHYNALPIALNASTITDAVPPGNYLAARKAERSDGLKLVGRAVTCPPEAPWLCDGRTCIDKLMYHCCRGGYICEVPGLCLLDPRGRIRCG